MAAKVKALGLKIDVARLKSLTGLEFIMDEENELWQPDAET